ncbi:MAG TPA: hypothetical protein VGM88_27800 [Kofleriaceae bacterium]|jgi:hypothetical protein
MRGFIVALGLVGGCMLGPTDNEQVAHKTDALYWTGYDTDATSTVGLLGWSWTSHSYTPFGVTMHPSSGGVTPAGGVTLYPWSSSQVVPSALWHAGPGGGSCAIVRSQTTHHDGTLYDLISVDDDWADCWNADPNTQHFYANCRASDSPLAHLYTSDWAGTAVVGAHPNDWLALNTLASLLVTLNINDYTSTAYQYCNSGNPAGCPPGGAGDPETWKFYMPNGSSISAGMIGPGGTTVFSIPPVRHPPDTVYLSGMNSTTIDFRVDSGKLVFGIDFADAGPEIITNCIRDASCFLRDHHTISFMTPRAEIWMTLALVGGQVHATNISTTFSTGNTDQDSIDAGNAIAAAFTTTLTTDPTIAAAFDGAVDQAVRVAAHLNGLPIQSITLGGSTMSVAASCAPI